MRNLERPIQMKFYVTEEEREFIRKKSEIANMKNVTSYLRKMAVDGYVFNVDYTEFKKISAAMQSISNSINQIAKRINATDNPYKEDMAHIKNQQEELWRLLKSTLSKLP